MAGGGGTIAGHSVYHGLAEAGHSFVTAAKHLGNELGPIELPSVAEMIDLHIKGWIDDTTLEACCKKQGVAIDVSGRTIDAPGATNYEEYRALWNTVYAASCEIPQPVEMREIANRQLLTDERYDRILKRYGFKSNQYREWVGNLRFDIPGPADLVRFSVRHVWEPDLLASLGYDEEFPGAIIDVWHAMKGLDYPLFEGPFKAQIDKMGGYTGYADQLAANYASFGLDQPTWARAFWWSHWILPSPGQGFGMLIRCAPDRDTSFDPPEAVGLEFNQEDYDLLLRANDYPPKYRHLLTAIQRPIPGVRFIRDFVKQGVYTYENLIEWARRWGYSPRDQKDIADDIWRNVNSAGQKATACKGCATCDAAFEVGILSDFELQQCYAGFGASAEEAARLTALARLKHMTSRAKAIVANVRKRFLKGTLSADQARNMLAGYGLGAQRVAEYIEDWQLEFEAGRKEWSASQAVKLSCEGFIDELALRNRLANLGYPPADINGLVFEAGLCHQRLKDAASAKQARADRQVLADAYTAQRRARQQMIEAQQSLSKHGSPAQLRKWFCEGAIGELEVFQRLGFLGWPINDITRLIGDCKQQSGKSGSTGGTGGTGGAGG